MLFTYIWATSWENLGFFPYANNKGADQPAHPRSLISTFIVHCLESSFYIQNFKPPHSFCGCAGRFVSYLVGNPEDRFSRDEAHLSFNFQIPTFALFRKWKAFSVWRRNVKTKKIHNCKKALNENLFIVNPVSLIYFNRNTVRSPLFPRTVFCQFSQIWSLRYCKFTIIRENFIFADIREFD